MTTFAKFTALLLIFMPLMVSAGVIPKEFNDQLKCVGMYPDGKSANVLYDPDSSTINLNGNTYKIQTTTTQNNGYATVDITDKDGTVIYLSIIETHDKNFKLMKYNSKTDKLINEIEIACHKPDTAQ